MSATITHLWALDAPTITVDHSIVLLGTGGTNVTLPIPTFLIQHGDDLLVFDTGLASEGAGDPHRAYGPLADMFSMSIPEEYRLDRQFAELGFALEDVTDVVISHMHFDHTGGLELFTHARGFIGEGELDYAKSPGGLDHGFFRPQDIEAADKIDWLEIPNGYEHDVYGDGSVIILSLPGHTPGTLALKVALPDGSTLVLSSDAAHQQANIDTLIGMPFDVDGVGKRRGLRTLKLLQAQANTKVWINHDMDHWTQNRPNGRQVA